MIPNQVLEQLKAKVYEYKDTMPVVMALNNVNLQDHHKRDIHKIIGKVLVNNDDLLLNHLLELNVSKVQEEIQEISIQASQEKLLDIEFSKQEENWKNLEFKVKQYNEKGNQFIIDEFNDLFNFIDEILANLNNILSNRYLKLLRKASQKLQTEILFASETLDDWMICQNNYIYLENIFKNSEIKGKLPTENAMFDHVDRFFIKTMKTVNSTKQVHKIIKPDLSKQLKKNKESL